MVHPGGPATRPRIMTKDRGLVEIDKRAGKIFVWGKRGIATELARDLANAGSWKVEHLEGIVEVTRRARRHMRSPATGSDQSRSPASQAVWWRERGYQAFATSEEVWVDIGTTRIRDLGDRLELYGPVSDETLLAVVTKAREEWDGAVEIHGDWGQLDRDRLWTECQRQGVVAANCSPSRHAIESWEREKASVAKRSETLSLLRAATDEAKLLRDVAAGDTDTINRLRPELRAFVASYLDDIQRAELGRMPVDSIIPELPRFRSLGHDERELAKRNGEPDPGLPLAPPSPSRRHSESSPRRV